jgi:energy-coupling factor transport system permease protein
MVERAGTIVDAQRARGLDTEGSIWRRARGVVPLVGPVILGSIAEVEERTMALEARGFTRPGRRTLLWHPMDSRRQALARWVLVILVPATLTARATGLLGWLG